MDDLKKQAEELGIEVDGRWGEDRLKQEIDAALAGPAAPTEQDAAKPNSVSAKPYTVSVKVLRDFWDENGNRVGKGTIVDVSVDAALDGVESGALARVKG